MSEEDQLAEANRLREETRERHFAALTPEDQKKVKEISAKLQDALAIHLMRPGRDMRVVDNVEEFVHELRNSIDYDTPTLNPHMREKHLTGKLEEATKLIRQKPT